MPCKLSSLNIYTFNVNVGASKSEILKEIKAKHNVVPEEIVQKVQSIVNG